LIVDNDLKFDDQLDTWMNILVFSLCLIKINWNQ